MRGGRWIIIACALALLVRAADASTMLIDDFTSATTDGTHGIPNPHFGCLPGVGQGTCFITDLNVAQAVVGSTTTTDGPLPDVLGGSRQLTVTAESLQSVTPPDLVVAGIVPLAGFLEYDSTAQADGRIELVYDGGGAGLGASIKPPQGVRVVILDADDASVGCEAGVLNCTLGYDVTVTLRDSLMHSASLTKTVLIPGGPLALTFPLENFSGIQGIQLGNIFSLSVAVDPNTAGDLRLDRIEIFRNEAAPTLSLGWTLVLIGVLTTLACRAIAGNLAK